MVRALPRALALGCAVALVACGGSTSDRQRSCARTTDRLSVEVTPPLDEQLNCSMHQSTEPAHWSGQGRVVESLEQSLTVDECSPNADCAASLRRLNFQAVGVKLNVPIDAFVEWRVSFFPSWGQCNLRVLVRNLPSWDTLANPITTSERIYFAGSDGTLETFPELPFTVTRVALGCSEHAGGNAVPPDEYALEIGSAAASERVAMGEEREIAIGDRAFRIRNLRSFQTEYTDDYWNWAFWAIEH